MVTPGPKTARPTITLSNWARVHSMLKDIWYVKDGLLSNEELVRELRILFALSVIPETASADGRRGLSVFVMLLVVGETFACWGRAGKSGEIERSISIAFVSKLHWAGAFVGREGGYAYWISYRDRSDLLCQGSVCRRHGFPPVEGTVRKGSLYPAPRMAQNENCLLLGHS